MIWFWSFTVYSALGCLLEAAYALAVGASPDRKCLRVLPLCPVYGLGMLAVLALPPDWTGGPWLPLSGGLAATAVEYAVHWAYERFLGVRFWDYSGVPGNLRGRVCLPFTLAWGALTAAAVQWVQPWVEVLAAAIPPEVTYLCLLLFADDALLSVRLLRRTHSVELLRA